MPTVHPSSLGGPKPQIELADGSPAVGGKLYFYVAGSINTKQDTYTDSTGTVQNTNPVLLNSLGFPTNEIWFAAGQAYKVVYAPSTDTDPPSSPIWTVDNLSGVNDIAAGTIDEWVSSILVPTFVSNNSFTTPGDQTSTLSVGRRLRLTDSGGTKYGTIVTSVFGAVTTVTLDMDATQVLQNPVNAISYGLLRPNNASVPGVVINGGAWVFQKTATLSPAQITGNQDNYAPVGLDSSSVLRLSTDASRNITGLAGGGLGLTMTIHNVGTFPVVFTYEDGASTAANRFAFGITLGGGQSMEIQYDAASLRWRAKDLPDPLGMVKDFAGALPSGYLAIDANYSRTTYASLFNIVGTAWGAGDGATTFGLFIGAGRYLVAAGTGTTNEAVTASSGNGFTVASNDKKWITGMSVVLSNLTGFTTSATAGPTYFISRVSATNVRLATTLALAQNGAPDVTISGTGTATLTHTYVVRTLGEIGGEQAHAMSSTEQLSHTHVQNAHAHTQRYDSSEIGGGAQIVQYVGAFTINDSGFSGANTNMTTSDTTATNQNTGGNAAANIESPFAVVTRGVKFC